MEAAAKPSSGHGEYLRFCGLRFVLVVFGLWSPSVGF